MTALLMSLFWVRVCLSRVQIDRQEDNGSLNQFSTVCLCLQQILVPVLLFLFPAFVSFYETKSAVSDITRPAAETVDRHTSPLCRVRLTGVSVAATLRFMGDWRCHQSARRVKSTVCPCCRSVLPACHCRQITVLKEEGTIFQSEAAMCLIPS